MTSRLVLDALHNAMRCRGYPPGVIVHSDRGSQFRSHAFMQAVRSYRALSSIGCLGVAEDNAAMESFFALLQIMFLTAVNSAVEASYPCQ